MSAAAHDPSAGAANAPSADPMLDPSAGVEEHEPLLLLASASAGRRATLAAAGIEHRTLLPLFASAADHLDIVETQLTLLLVQPRHAPFHRLDQDPLDIRTSDREHQARKTGTGPHVGNATTGREQGSGDRRVEDVPVPQPRRFKWTDQAALLAVRRQRGGETARQIQPVTEHNGSGCRLGLDLARCFT